MFGIIGGYLFLLSLLTAAGAIAGFLAHHVRAATGGDERPLWDDGITGFFLRQEHDRDKMVGWKFGSDGWYDGLSNSNLVRYVAGGALIPLVLGLVFFQPAIAVFVEACQSLAVSGMAPRFCP